MRQLSWQTPGIDGGGCVALTASPAATSASFIAVFVVSAPFTTLDTSPASFAATSASFIAVFAVSAPFTTLDTSIASPATASTSFIAVLLNMYYNFQ